MTYMINLLHPHLKLLCSANTYVTLHITVISKLQNMYTVHVPKIGLTLTLTLA